MVDKEQKPIHAERGNKEVDPDFFRRYTDYGAITQEMAKENKKQMRRGKNR